LKPENILLSINRDIKGKPLILVKVTDFGSACFKSNTLFTYIQSIYYRAPEVMMGLKYGQEIDIWSIGCIAAELIIGVPLFSGINEIDQLTKILHVIKEPNLQSLIRIGKKREKYFCFNFKDNTCTLKTLEEYQKVYF
jgi:serine/threonine protein kinase